MRTLSEHRVEFALNVLLDVRAETTDTEALARVNDAITATHKIVEPEVQADERARPGTRVESRRSEGYGIAGTVEGWDPDLGLPLIRWEAPWDTIGLEACEPDQYEVIQ